MKGSRWGDETRAWRVEVYEETLEAIRRGSYEIEGKRVFLPDPLEVTEGSTLYAHPGPIGRSGWGFATEIEVVADDTLLAGKALLDAGYRACVLNFASRRQPGGGVLTGSGAQEENIFRRTNLAWGLYQYHEYASVIGVPRARDSYPMDRNTGGAYSPGVTVFRGTEPEEYPFLAEPYMLGVVTVAALNRPPLRDADHLADTMVEPTRRKMRTILRIALRHGHDAIVLGAWGCGAFANPPRHIAELFKETLDEDEFRGAFRKVVFAIYDRAGVDDRNGKRGNLPAFRDVLA